MADFGDGLVHAPPDRPGEEGIEGQSDREQQTADEVADLAHPERDHRPGWRVVTC